ncbi:bifunctional diaminohydroxyphosphoribosylaminopyrimidine deaminase/5-amino-6-(5-phosphoribosylamino)uracil reductase RibD [Clostridium felsineum]|uniref:bifunctional diaminohydroxyphosphoribosylaminopyrimidine deaminase/5-amino-6-(5-phosphoribosylamino)uracil reductase RibD n=1 Tax=Clostridium felsineum TaxID=36839 RepID=UPI00098BD10E|nr:bifunctional diaminohydroxyphosphoribosylaminopyrimidine deaminase/5-amino-6-(5-phosphoribosylamino)uracil reductase RibD [Clostridium felsineum]
MFKLNEAFMKRALDIAKKGSGYVNPNPMVGAVIVKDNKIIGEGYHEKFGGNHAEVNALKMAGDEAKGAELYVTLEPCSHYGKTPPCALAVVKAGIKKVIIAMEDPNPLVSSRGIKILRDKGIDVVIGIMKEEAEKLNEVFIKYIRTKKPFVVMKTACTLDGKICTVSGENRWISGEASRRYVHYLRSKYMGIMVGVDTAILDNPLLTTRVDNKKLRSPTAIIVDSKLRVPFKLKIFDTLSERKIILATTELAEDDKVSKFKDMGVTIIKTPNKNGRVDLNYLMNELGDRGVDSILLEGGSKLNFSCLKEKITDKVNYFVAPIIVGGEKSKGTVGGDGIDHLSDAIKIFDVHSEKIGQDILITGYVNRR